MEAGKETSIHQDKANNYKKFQNVFQVKQVFQARVSSKYFKQLYSKWGKMYSKWGKSMDFKQVMARVWGKGKSGS